MTRTPSLKSLRKTVLTLFFLITIGLQHVNFGVGAQDSTSICDAIQVGDILFTYLNSFDPDIVQFFTLEDIPGDLKLYLTDNAWTGTSFQSNEGTLELTLPPEGIPQGTNFGYGGNLNFGNAWVAVEGAFALDPVEGEQLFLYCVGDAGIVPLAAMSFNGPFQEGISAGNTNFGLNESALPSQLAENGTITLSHCDEWRYSGPQTARVDEIQAAMQNPNQWRGQSCGKGGSAGVGSVFTWKKAAIYTSLCLTCGLVTLFNELW